MIRQHHSSFRGLTFRASLLSALAALAPLGCGSNETSVVKANNGSQGGTTSTSTTATTAVGGSSSNSSSSTSSSVGGTAAGGTKASTGGTKANTGGTKASTTTSSTEEATGGDENAGGTTSEDTSAGGTENAGGTTSEDTSAGGTENAGGTDGAGGTAATGGTKATSTKVCADGIPFKLSTDIPLMTDFSDVTPTSYDDTSTATQTTPKWGKKGLTGGTFFYHQEAADGIKFSVVDETNSSVTSGKVAELKASMLAGHYAGFGFYFGPDCGTNACDYSGFSFKITGELGGATVDVQMQMTPDYPLNTDNKGTCDFGGVEADKWSSCTNPHAALADVLASEFPLVIYEEVLVPWTSLIDGKPVGPIDCGQLLGIQIQLNCPEDADCTPDIKIADLKFYK